MRRTFVETRFFQAEVENLGGQALLGAIQDEIARDPDSGDLIPGSGGLRKIRVADEGKGKRGGYRVIYLDLPEREVTYLIWLYRKVRQENLSQEDLAAFRQIVALIKKQRG